MSSWQATWPTLDIWTDHLSQTISHVPLQYDPSSNTINVIGLAMRLVGQPIQRDDVEHVSKPIPPIGGMVTIASERP
jgi:hypothetical protein